VAAGYPKVLFAEETVSILFEKTHGFPESSTRWPQALLPLRGRFDPGPSRAHRSAPSRDELPERSRGNETGRGDPTEAPVRTETRFATVMEVRPIAGARRADAARCGGPAPRLDDRPASARARTDPSAMAAEAPTR
jgi:hypothetical protein